MGDFASISGSSSQQAAEAREQVAEKTRDQRTSYIQNANGDKVGGNYTVEKGDFGHFLGYRQPTAAEASGKEPMSGARVIEVALQKEMAELGEGAAKHGSAYKNIHVPWGRYNNEPGRERDMIKDGLDGMREAFDKNSMESKVGHATVGQPQAGAQPSAAMSPYFEQMYRFQKASQNDNVKMLEMQYKFSEMSKQNGTISNLMKTRHDALTRVIRGNS